MDGTVEDFYKYVVDSKRRVAELFLSFDRDGDCRITENEFLCGIQSLNLRMAKMVILDMIRDCKRDADGCLNFQEFATQLEHFSGAGARGKEHALSVVVSDRTGCPARLSVAVRPRPPHAQ